MDKLRYSMDNFFSVKKNKPVCHFDDYFLSQALLGLPFKKKIMKKVFVSMSFLFFMSLAVLAQKAEVFSPSEGAIHGYDPVAYFKESKPVKGDKKYSLSWNAATWYFTSQQNLEIFKMNPQMYAPQYGGYCAYGLANGHKAPTDPQAWLIADGKLYLNYNKDVQKSWKAKQSEYIQTADKLWPELKDKE